MPVLQPGVNTELAWILVACIALLPRPFTFLFGFSSLTGSLFLGWFSASISVWSPWPEGVKYITDKQKEKGTKVSQNLQSSEKAWL